MTKITTASLSFHENGTPVSKQFDDVYYERDEGLTESEYVFQQGSLLPDRWLDFDNSLFTIAETGFGTGLNFLAVCNIFAEFKTNHPTAKLQRLHFISFEKYPLRHADLTKSLARWQSVSVWSEQLLNQYPSQVSGVHRLHFGNDISLDLWLGDIADTMPQLDDKQNGIVDAWFLDGFAPRRNPDMWNEALFDNMTRLAKQHCTFATFTASSFVRRALIAKGFVVQKRKGFGTKREMMFGQRPEKPEQLPMSVHFPTYSPKCDKKTIAIIGGGIAAITSAERLINRGYQVDIYCQHELADAASGNHQGAIYPLLQKEHNTVSEFYAKAFEYAVRYYQHWQKTIDFKADFCGLLHLAFNEEKQARLAFFQDSELWPTSLLDFVDARQASKIAGINIEHPALYFQQAGWLNPVSFVKNLAAQLKTTGLLQVFSDTPVDKLQQQAAGWKINEHPATPIYDSVVIACGHQSNLLAQTKHLPIPPVRGQVSELTSQGPLSQLKTIICHKGYLTPELDGKHCAGATFTKQSTDTSINEQDNQTNRMQQQVHLTNSGIEFESHPIVNARAAIRATTPDHLPLVGPVYSPDTIEQFHQKHCEQQTEQESSIPSNSGLYILSGLGSRGLCSAPLCAEHLASLITGEPLPFATQTLQALHPNRFKIRALNKNSR